MASSELNREFTFDQKPMAPFCSVARALPNIFTCIKSLANCLSRAPSREQPMLPRRFPSRETTLYRNRGITLISIPHIFRRGRIYEGITHATLRAAVVSASYFSFLLPLSLSLPHFFRTINKPARIGDLVCASRQAGLFALAKLLVTPDQFIGRQPPRWWRNRARRCWS